jgi:NADH:ubiquinone oxidoreductase subunit 6 (subunit J)
MLLNIKLTELSENTTRYAPLGVIMGFVLFSFIYELISKELSTFSSVELSNTFLGDSLSSVVSVSNIEQIGSVLYTEY